MRIVFLLFTIISALYGGEKSLSVVIIGAGPVGLAMAIEASKEGHVVTLVERRACYTRKQGVFLFEPALDLLKKWEVSLPDMVIGNLSDKERVGILEINMLEKALAQKVNSLNVTQIHGEFACAHDSFVEIVTENGVALLPYDVLVGADGFHSRVRDEVATPCIIYEKATVSSAHVAYPSSLETVEIPTADLYKGLYVKKMVTPAGSYIVLQKSINSPNKELDIRDPKLIEEVARAFGWNEEAELIANGQTVISEEIDVVMQQAMTFSNSCKSMILVGDAAAVASFIQGMGVNYGFQTVILAAQFLEMFQEDKVLAYMGFNNNMQSATNELIQDSQYLIICH